MAVEHLKHVLLASEIPIKYKSFKGEKSAFWEAFIRVELDTHHKNRTWTVVLRSEGANILTSKIKIKDVTSSSINATESLKLDLP